MRPLLVLSGLLFSLHTPSCSVATDTLSRGHALSGDERLVSGNGKFALGFFQTGSKSSHNTLNWYLGIWYNRVPKLTPVWTANGDNPLTDPTSSELTISNGGNLVILNQSTNSVVWSTQINTTNNTVAILLNNGNLILQNSSHSSNVLWQSFDYPTDTFLPGAKLGWDKVTGLNRRLVSRKNLIDLAPGRYCEELDPSGVNQFIFTLLNLSIPYWFSGVWNGQYFPSVPEMSAQGSGPAMSNFTFVSNDQEKYFTYNLLDETIVTHHLLDVSGRTTTSIWLESSQDWVMHYAQPRAQCDVYAVCGPFTVCNDNELLFCKCMKGFSIGSPEDWELEDRTGGCIRNTPLDCVSNKSTGSSTDKFYSIPCVRLPHNAHHIEAATSADKCETVCLIKCSCTAYSYYLGDCFIWHNELLNVKQQQCNDITDTNGGTLFLRLSEKEEQSQENSVRGTMIAISLGVSFPILFSLALVLKIWWNKRKRYSFTLNNAQGGSGIVAFRYTDLQHATKNFSEKLGEGGFGSIFKGFLRDSTTVAVKRLDGVHQGEKQFRAEVSSLGLIQHINLIKLIGFCCSSDRKLLVYEYMPNRSLDIHLFSGDAEVLNWNTRYQIALGVARGLAYLHESCRDCIIHCDVKPQNILLDESFIPKIADFGMAKFLGRDFSRALTTMRGTIGYLAPEWISGVAITPKVDVYSYGMLLLEIVSGRRNSHREYTTISDDDAYFPVQVARKLLVGDVGSLVDHKLHGDVNIKEAERACKVACWCIQDNEVDRPTMGEVVQILEGLIEVGMPPMPRLLQAIAGGSHSA
ncbi:G-type lectin S-receptor-like serine/threonine-protein kinase At2g19130 [Phragmites australis]|uniref:G-type lectin S-receptor-like serine/threonine-protein kinase At2g19130 n=1 Tax=Phragmites australis TaxID=29695 RepID=UPI002D76C255|nr:G-type lectin S-receptor-like serine/threonine-protein kinase At2g19130 [Phragmites australis]